jgi:hypothetical protein
MREKKRRGEDDSSSSDFQAVAQAANPDNDGEASVGTSRSDVEEATTQDAAKSNEGTITTDVPRTIQPESGAIEAPTQQEVSPIHVKTGNDGKETKAKDETTDGEFAAVAQAAIPDCKETSERGVDRRCRGTARGEKGKG